MEKKIDYDPNVYLGHGSYGTEVYKGSCEGIDVAVKIIVLRNGKQRFFDEYRQYAKIIDSGGSDYIVKCHGFDLSPDQCVYVALELCNATLMDHDLKSLNCDEKVNICHQLTSGVAYLHSKQIVHGDLSPTNVLVKLCHNEICMKIADFGMSKTLPDRGRTLLRASSGNRATEWMAPELLKVVQKTRESNANELYLETTYTTDVFSLGCLKFFIITGGLHVFGEMFSREINILQQRPHFELECIENNLLPIVCLIYNEISFDPWSRLSSADILSSPSLWKKSLDDDFLKAIQECIWSSTVAYNNAIPNIKRNMIRYLEYSRDQKNSNEAETLENELLGCGLEYITQLISMKLGHDIATSSRSQGQISQNARSFWLDLNFKVWKYIIFQAFQCMREAKSIKKYYLERTFEDDMIQTLQKCSRKHLDTFPISNVPLLPEDTTGPTLQYECLVSDLCEKAKTGSSEAFMESWNLLSSNHYLADEDAFKILTNVAQDTCANNADIIRQRLIIIDTLCLSSEDVLFLTTQENTTVLHLTNLHVDIIIHLIKLGATVPAVDDQGNTVMHLSPNYLTPIEYHKLISVVLKRRLDVVFSILSKLRESPISVATRCFTILPETLKILSDKGLINDEPSSTVQDVTLPCEPIDVIAEFSGSPIIEQRTIHDAVQPIWEMKSSQEQNEMDHQKKKSVPKVGGMEEWQKNHITRNLRELLDLTEFNIEVKAELIVQNILSKADIEYLDALQMQQGKYEATLSYYQLLMGRTNAYKVLMKTLLQTHQTGSARILIGGVPETISDKPLTYFDISTKYEELEDMEIEVNGKTMLMNKFLPAVNYENLQKIFQDTVDELEIYDTFVTKQKTFVLAKNTVPPKPRIYLPRSLSNQIKIDESIFKADCPDVFVFQNSMPRYKLFQLARPNSTDTSTSQLTKITCRFIYLDENEDWIELKKSAKVPIHLINFEKEQNHFILGDTSAPSDILRNFSSRNERMYFSEEEFVHRQLSEDLSSSSVCICDTPGMGKTFLLAKIAQLMTENSTGRIIVFIPLVILSNDSFPGNTDTMLESDKSLLKVLGHISHRGKNSELLLKLIKAQILKMEIFFDGFDELPADQVEWAKQVFQSFTRNFSNVRIYITSRPHMRQELENCLGVVAYDMLPFSQQNQVEFLVQFWFSMQPRSDQIALRKYATSCLEAVSQSHTKNDKQISGIPLLCHLIAEIYADKTRFASIETRAFSDNPVKIPKMYQKYIEIRIQSVAKSNKEFHDIKLVHVWHALKLLFSTYDFHKNNQFRNVRDLLTSTAVLRVGILQKHSHIEFISRTFAEYLAAEYFCTKLQNGHTLLNEEMSCDSIAILKLILECAPRTQDYGFMHPVVVSFFNFALGDADISEELKIQAALFVTSTSNEQIIIMLCACCQHNLHTIFTLLREALMKNDYSRILESFTSENSYELLSVCIQKSTGRMFHNCIQLLTEVAKLDITPIARFHPNKSLIQIAVSNANYAAVEYFVNRIPLQGQLALKECGFRSYFDNSNIHKRVNILRLLLIKDPTLINETPDILSSAWMHTNLIKVLIKFGASLTSVDKYGENCVMLASRYMSPTDFDELTRFLLIDCKAECLFLDHEKWRDPFPTIVKCATLLPETLLLILKVTGIDINMKDKHGNSLLFSAVRGDKLSTLQQLINLGLDYNARDKGGRSLLHAAASKGGQDIIHHLLSLKLDPKSCTKRKRTTLHDAVYNLNGLPVLRIFVENGVDVNAKDYKGRTALHLSAQLSHTEAIKYLIEMGAYVNDPDKDGNTSLHFCKIKQVNELLVGMGADNHIKNAKGQTAAEFWQST